MSLSPTSNDLSPHLYPSDSSDSGTEAFYEQEKPKKYAKKSCYKFKKIKAAVASYYSSEKPVQEIAREYKLSFPSLQAKINLVEACEKYLPTFVQYGMHSSKTLEKIEQICEERQSFYSPAKIQHLLKLAPDYKLYQRLSRLI